MPLIKCPKCNHTVLSAASSCPNCGSIMDPEQRDEIRVDRRWRMWMILPAVGVAALLAVVVWRAQADGALSLPRAASAPANQATLLPDQTPLTGEPDTAASATSADTTSPQEMTQLSASPPRQHAVDAPSVAQTLWTQTWVNVRERPGTTSAVVKILTPGQPVDVVNPERQWSLVFVDGEQLGYLSVALLAQRPPGP